MTEPHARIDGRFIENTAGLSSYAKWIYVCLKFRRNNGSGEAFPSYDDLQKLTGLNRSRIAAGLNELEAAGWINKRKRFGKSTVYRFVKKSSSPDSQTTDSPDSQTTDSSKVRTTDTLTRQLEPDNKEPDNSSISSIRTIPSSEAETITEPPKFTANMTMPIEHTPPATQTPIKRTQNYRPIFGWLQSLTKLNALTRIGKVAKEIDATGACLETCQLFERYWWACDWRGQKQQRPTPEQVWETWPRALDWDGKTTVRVNSNGRADEPAGFRAIREAMADPRYKQAQERKKNG